MPAPSIGRIVHYVSTATGNPVCRAAEERCEQAGAALAAVRAQCADWAEPTTSATRDGRLRDAVTATCADVILRALGDLQPATAQAAADPWPTITRLTAWLDDRNGSSTSETALRILKVTEEAGEVAQAWIGMTGQNPRKGITHTANDVADELCDVITADPAQHFTHKIQQIAAIRLTDQTNDAPNPPYDLPTGTPSWGDWAGA